ncbi:hypothetical protein [Mycobacterium sp. ZZG]
MGIYITRSQPYPALTMPGFAGTPTDDGVIDWNAAVIEVRMSDGEVKEVEYEDILPENTGVLRSSVFRANFSDESVLRNPAKVAWLQERASRIFPNNTIEGVTILWQRYEYNINEHVAVSPQVQTTKRLDIDFKAAR